MKYLVTFKETYTYTKEIHVPEGTDIYEVIHEDSEYPMVAHMTRTQYNELNADVLNEYEIKEICNE